MNIQNLNNNLNISTRTQLEKELCRTTLAWLKDFIENTNKSLDLMNTRLPLKNIMFYYAFAEKLSTLGETKDKELVKEFKSFYDTCETYELLYYYFISIDNAMCVQYELNNNLVETRHELAYDDLFVYTILANLSLVGLILKHNLLENEIEYFIYDKDLNDFKPILRRSQVHLFSTRFTLPFLVSQETLEDSATLTSKENVSRSIVELGVKFKQDLYLKTVYGKVFNKLFSTRPYTEEQELFLDSSIFISSKKLPIDGIYIVPNSEDRIHSIYVRESLFETIDSLDCCIRYKDDTSSNLCIFKDRPNYIMIQGIDPVKTVKYVLQYLEIEDYGLDFRVISN